MHLKLGKGPKTGGKDPNQGEKTQNQRSKGVVGCCGGVMGCRHMSLPVPGRAQTLSTRSSHENILRDMETPCGTRRGQGAGDIRGGTGTHGRGQGHTGKMGMGSLRGNRDTRQWIGTRGEGQGHTGGGQGHRGGHGRRTETWGQRHTQGDGDTRRGGDTMPPRGVRGRRHQDAHYDKSHLEASGDTQRGAT